MPTEALTLNRSVVLGSAIIYWSGVWIQARRVRQRIGRSPNVQPKGLKEKLLWGGWAFVVVAWMTLPLLGAGSNQLPGLGLIPFLVHPFGSIVGIIMMALGYAGTLWCYQAMGDAWRMGINRSEETHLVMNGPYQFVRHPIYLCQVVMVAAVAVLLPSVLSGMVLVVHLLCVATKAADEESHLRMRLGQSYNGYLARTGAWFPPLLRKKSPERSSPAPDQDQLKAAGHPSK
jgi:protein-S-isoprenylcysteine O-methyltransferase Ste14